MMKMVLLLLLVTVTTFAGESYWKTVFKEKGITTYLHEEDSSPFKEFKGVGIDSAAIEDIATILYDIEGYKKWVPYLGESVLLKKYSEDSILIYHKYEVPWPFDDRDCVVLATIQRDFKKGLLLVKMKAINSNQVEVPQGTTRITFMEGSIALKYVNKSVTEGVYTEKIDFGGSFPIWLSNHLAQEIPHKVLLNIQKTCKEGSVELSEDGRKVRDGIEKSIAEGYLK